MTARLATVAALAVIAVGATIATSATSADAATVGVVVSAPAPWREPVEVSATAFFEPRGATVQLAALSRRDADALARCYGDNDEACAAPIAARARVDALFLLVVTVVPDGDEEAVVTVGGWQLGRDGRVVAFDVESCEACRPPAIGVATASLLASLNRMSRGRQRGAVRVKATPAGARVVIDGVAIGLAPLTHPLKIGAHTVRIERDGYTSATRRVTVADRQTAEVAVQLRADDGSGRRAGRRLGTATWVIGGLGAVALTTGVVLIAIDSPPAADGVDSSKSYGSTAGVGIALGATGIAGLLTATYLGFIRTPARAPTVQVSSGGLSVGYRTSF